VTSTPYLSAKRSWDERYGSVLSASHKWQIAFMLATAALLLSMAANVMQLARAKFSVWIVATDSVGRVVASGPASHTPVVDDRMKRAALTEWIMFLRGVTKDQAVQARQTKHVFAFVAKGSPAVQKLQSFFFPGQGGVTPFERAKTLTVDIEMESVLPTSDKSYEVRWMETTRDVNGEPRGVEHYTSAITLAPLNPPSDEELALVNPFGIYITHISWSLVKS
jgi:type IV secretion system protein VirB5